MHSEFASDPLEPARLRVVLVTIVLNIGTVAVLTLAPWSNWRTGLALNRADNAILLAFVLGRRDALPGRFMVFGLEGGVAELAADAWLPDSD